MIRLFGHNICIETYYRTLRNLGWDYSDDNITYVDGHTQGQAWSPSGIAYYYETVV